MLAKDTLEFIEIVGEKDWQQIRPLMLHRFYNYILQGENGTRRLANSTEMFGI